MDSSAQVSIEYLVTVMFAVILVVAATLIATQLTTIATIAQSRIIGYRESTIASLMG